MSSEAEKRRAAHLAIGRNADKDGEFRRKASAFRDTISPNGRFPPAKKRYYLVRSALLSPSSETDGLLRGST